MNINEIVAIVDYDRVVAENAQLKSQRDEAMELLGEAIEDIPKICETCNVEKRVDKDCYCNQNLNPNTYLHTAWQWQHQDRYEKLKSEVGHNG